MGIVHHLQQFHLTFDAKTFIASHHDCPDEPELLQELWQLVAPAIFWREEPISSNDGEQLVLGKRRTVYCQLLCLQRLAAMQAGHHYGIDHWPRSAGRSPQSCRDRAAISQRYRRLFGLPRCRAVSRKPFASICSSKPYPADYMPRCAIVPDMEIGP